MARNGNMAALAAVAFAFAGASAPAGAGTLSDRWVWVESTLLEKDSVDTVSNIVSVAKAGGMNGIMLGCGLDFYRIWSKDRRERLARIKRICDDFGFEVVPTIWSLGHGSMLQYGLDYIDGMPVNDIPYVAEGTNAVFDAASAKVTHVDAKSDIQRLGGYRRQIKRFKVTPNRKYRYSFEFRTTGLVGDAPFEVLVSDSRGGQFRPKESMKVPFKSTQGWTPCSIDFNSGESDTYFIYVGFMRGWKSGDFELRDVTLSEFAPSHVLRRPGAPRSLRNAATGRVYEEGRDYVVPKMTYPVTRSGMPPVVLSLPPGSGVKPGDRLLFDCHAPAVVFGQHVAMCLSEPRLYEFLEDSARNVEAALHPKKWHFSMDEFRVGGTCAACRARGMTMAQIYADAVTKMFNIVRKVHPGAEVYIWSDMLDPNHNGIEEYWGCRGSFEGAWKWIPKDIVVCCWYGDRSETSLKFFSSHGFRTLAAAYYDEKPPFAKSRRWRDGVLATDGATGIMYTTWRHKYDDLPAFCRMLAE